MNEKDLTKLIEFLENKNVYLDDEIYWPWYKMAISELVELSELLFK